MGLRCYYKQGGKELIDGVGYFTAVRDESHEDELLADGWSRTPDGSVRSVEAKNDDEVMQLLKDAAKERGIKGWQRMGEAKLREVLGLNDGDEQE